MPEGGTGYASAEDLRRAIQKRQLTFEEVDQMLSNLPSQVDLGQFNCKIIAQCHSLFDLDYKLYPSFAAPFSGVEKIILKFLLEKFTRALSSTLLSEPSDGVQTVNNAEISILAHGMDVGQSSSAQIVDTDKSIFAILACRPKTKRSSKISDDSDSKTNDLDLAISVLCQKVAKRKHGYLSEERFPQSELKRLLVPNLISH